MAGLESSEGSEKEFHDKSRESRDYDAIDKAHLIAENARIDARKTRLEADMGAERAAIAAEERHSEAGKAAAEAAERWRTKNRQRFAYIVGVVKKEVKKNAQKDVEHDQRIGQHEEKLNDHEEKHEALHQRVGQIEISHIDHKARMILLEQRHSEHATMLERVSGQNKWIVPVVATLGITGGIAVLVWLISKFLEKKGHSNDEKGELEDDMEDVHGRVHARAWRITPEVRGRDRGKYSDKVRARRYYTI